MSVERVLPKTLDYTDVLPLAVESKSRRRTFFPNNGAEFISNGANIIRIDISADALLDTQHSYLRFTFDTQSGVGAAHAQTRGLDYAGGHAFIRRLRVEQSGTVLEDIQSYNRLMGAVVLPCQSTSEHKATRTITEAICGDGATVGARAVNPFAGGNATTGQTAGTLGFVNNSATQIPAAGPASTQEICIPLTSGLLNCDKLVPLMLMSAPLTIEIELANETQACITTGGAALPYRIGNVRYVAQLVEVGQDVAQQLRMLQEVSGGVLTLAGQTYRHFQGQLPAAAASNVINVPARVKSMKSLFFASQGAGADAVATYDVATGGHMGLVSYQLKIGSVVYPPTAVSATAAGISLSTSAECLMELEKAWGNTGSRFGLSNETNMSTFYSELEVRSTGFAGVGAAVGNGMYRFAPFGLDLEAFQKVAIESGVNTADRSLPISLITEHTGAQAVTTIDVWVLADALFYINQDGSMSVSV
jgi:hypothetical protein|tara:strand:- start:1490 stop:2917 length:1428 start_codon:yes stop_codon:yes gene_type:complete